MRLCVSVFFLWGSMYSQIVLFAVCMLQQHNFYFAFNFTLGSSCCCCCCWIGRVISLSFLFRLYEIGYRLYNKWPHFQRTICNHRRERKTTIRHEKLRKSAKKKEIMNQLAFDDRSIYEILSSHSLCIRQADKWNTFCCCCLWDRIEPTLREARERKR